jgi:hypothetical protein
LLDEVHDCGRQLVSTSRTRTLGNQSRQAFPLESGEYLVVGHTRKTEVACRLGHRLPLHAHPAEHLVLHLDQVLGIEESVFLEQPIVYLSGTPIQRARLPEGLPLGILAPGHEDLPA